MVHCSGIYEILKNPKGCTNLTAKQRIIYDKLIAKDGVFDEKEENTFKHYTDKINRFNDPELSQSAIKYLIKRYAWEKYNKKTAATGFMRSPAAKGNELEDEAVIMLSELDKVKYIKPEVSTSNNFILGKCDILCPEQNKIVDIKTAWNINTFLPCLTTQLSRQYWFQMQGYLEIYNADYGEVCFMLLNTPIHLVERERAKYTEKYVFGEINRERYDEEMEKLDLAFNYNKIPEKRRVIRYIINRCPEILPRIYQRVKRCREWLNHFEKVHLTNKRIVTLAEQFINAAKEDNTESDSDESRESD